MLRSYYPPATSYEVQQHNATRALTFHHASFAKKILFGIKGFFLTISPIIINDFWQEKVIKSKNTYVIDFYCGVWDMEILQHGNIVLIGFSVWLLMAPRIGNPRYGELFLAYMTALLFSLIGSSELMMTKPTAFFFTIGGVPAFFYVLFRSTVRISVKK
jgi:hypothetical protein